MIKVTINENEYLMCDEWKDVNFGQYIDILNIQQDTWEDLEKSIKLMSALSDKPKELEEALYEMDLNDFNQLSDNMKWINSDFIKEAEASEKKDFFLIDDKKYVIKKDHTKLTLGEMVSVETMLKNPNLNHQEIALGVLIREVVDGKEAKFDSDFFYYVINELKYKINLIEVYQYIAFFLSSDKKSITSSSKGFSIIKAL